MVALRDIIKTITTAVKTATADSDGQTALDAIESYLDEPSTALADPSSLDRFSSDLKQLYETAILSQKTTAVVSTQSIEATRLHMQHYMFLRCLHALTPLLRPSRIFQDWFPFLKPILMTATYTNNIKKETRLIISDSLITEQEEEEDTAFFDMMVESYLDYTEKYQKKQEKEQLDHLEQPVLQQHQVLLDLEQDEWSRNLTTILLSVGSAQTKQFFSLLNKYYLSSTHRLQIVYLLSEFMRKKRTHLHEILDTPLFTSMLNSLMFDNSTTLIAISVTNMIMLLPRICTLLPPFLPQLFYIFARAICWDQLRDLRKKQANEIYLLKSRTLAKGWDCVDYTFSKLSAPPSNPQTGAFFTSLYGLYPCNFVKFLHKPYVYFKENKFEIPEEFDEETFKTRTLSQVSRHMLHPNLVAMDAESELTDKTRLLKMEPPDVIAQIMGLDLTNAASRVAFSESEKNAHHPLDLLDQKLWDEQQNEQQTDQPPVPEEKTNKKSNTEKSVTISNIIQLHRALKSGAEVLVGDDVWDAGSEFVSSGHTSPTENNSSETKLLLAALKREVLLLRNELNFELFLKQQHLQHIGRLHREHVLDSTVEAERQQLYNTTRMLKAQLHQTTTALEKLKAESAMTKQKHIKWEDEQSNKLRSYREARKEWQNQMTRSTQQLDDYKTEMAQHKQQLDAAREHIFDLQNELKTLEPTVERMTENEHRVKQLTQQMLLWEEDTAHMEEQKKYIKGLLSQWWSMEELVSSLQNENDRLQSTQLENKEMLEKFKMKSIEYESRIDNMNKSFQKNKTSNENEHLQKTLDELRKRIEDLEIDKLEKDAELEALRFNAKQQT